MKKRTRLGLNGLAVMTFDEIAAELGASNETVRIAYWSAMRKLAAPKRRRHVQEMRDMVRLKEYQS